MKPKTPLTVSPGERYGRLITVERVKGPDGDFRQYWNCLCDCGAYKVIMAYSFVKSLTRSCGCLNRETLDLKVSSSWKNKSRLYDIWRHIIIRCEDHKCRAYPRYGGRGIKICEEWKNDYESFKKWSEDNGYNDTLTIDRIDNNQGYNPSNCRWATRKEQQRNKTNNRLIEYNGETKCIGEWVEILGIRENVLRFRIENGWSIERAFTTPVKAYKKREKK